MQKLISAADACTALFNIPVNLRYETVSLAETLGRTAAERICAQIPVPPFDRSPYDGYAFRGGDTACATPENPAVLTITEEIPAGKQPLFEVTPGHAAKILTGAPIPVGADSTIKYELCEFTETSVKISKPVKPNTDVVYAGADVKPGDVVADSGTLITPPLISSLANQGFSAVSVCKKPVITIISTGSELREVGSELPPAAIYAGSFYTLAGYLENAGAVAVSGGIADDDPESVARCMLSALERSDMVITTGGVSVGDYDFTAAAAKKLGAEVLFTKLDMKPGGSMMAALLDGKVIAGLSGNPGAAVIGLLRVCMPYIKKLCGRRDCHYNEIHVKLSRPFLKSSPKTRVLRGFLTVVDGQAYFSESFSQGSETVTSFIGADLLAEIPAGSPPLDAGALVKAYLI